MSDRFQRNIRRCNILLLFCAAACLVCYDIHGGLWLKGVTSSWFVLLGFVNLWCGWKTRIPNFRFVILVETGLFFGMCADVLLGIQFYLGVAFFALGHVLYLVAFCLLEKPSRKDLLCILPVAVMTIYLITGTPFIQINVPGMQKLLIGYGIIISGMLGKAISNFTVSRTLSRGLLLVGAILFWFSDLILAIDMFGQSSRLTWILCSYTYWPAQNILAHSLLPFIREQLSERVV